MNKKKRTIAKPTKDNQIIAIIEALEEVRSNEFVRNSELFGDDFKRVIDRLKDDSFRFAVVGEFSSGKSTFLNALIGRDLLKHGAQETTATVTEIHNIQTEGNRTLLEVYYVNGNIEKNVNVDNITEYTATASKTHAVAKEIERVVINSKILDNDAQVCFVDTPGLNGIADNHREKTIEQIKNAHACIYLMQVRGLGQSDIEFLKYITRYQRNIIFVQNFIDELKRLEGETPEQKIREQKKIIEEKIVGDDESIHYNIVAVSSRMALIARSSEFEKYNEAILTNELRDALYEKSRFEDVFIAINNLIDNNEREKTNQKDAVSVALNLLTYLKKVVFFENAKELDEWAQSVEGRNHKYYARLVEILMENKAAYIQKLENFIEAETADIRKDCKRAVDDGLQDIEDSAREILSNFSIISEFEQYVDESLTDYLYQRITAVDEETSRQMNIQFENLVADAVLRINQYTGAEVDSIKPTGFEARIEDTDVKSFTKEEDEITRLQKQLYERRRLDEKARSDIQAKKIEREKISSEIEAKKSLISHEKNKKEFEISRLGAMPEKETKYRTETHYEYRGGFGIIDAICGPKEVTRLVPYTDDANQKRWEKMKSDIETKYREKENQINAQCRMLESRRRQCNEEILHIEHTEVARKKDMQSTERLLASKVEYLHIQKEKVKQEYLREAKKSVVENIHRYLQEYIQEILTDNYQDAIEKNKVRVEKIINQLFELSYSNRIESLNNKISKNDNLKNGKNTGELLQVIQNTSNKLEAFLCQQ